MAVTMAIHEIKDHLSRVIARLAESGEDVHITKHGRVVAVLTAPPTDGVLLGLGERPDRAFPEIDQLRWSPEELADMFGGSVFPT
jgi:prevent-host-death family protein